jgi:hypothetical protein
VGLVDTWWSGPPKRVLPGLAGLLGEHRGGALGRARRLCQAASGAWSAGQAWRDGAGHGPRRESSRTVGAAPRLRHVGHPHQGPWLVEGQPSSVLTWAAGRQVKGPPLIQEQAWPGRPPPWEPPRPLRAPAGSQPALWPRDPRDRRRTAPRTLLSAGAGNGAERTASDPAGAAAGERGGGSDAEPLIGPGGVAGPACRRGLER